MNIITKMPKLQIDIPEKLNQKLKFKKVLTECPNLQATLILFMEEKLDEWRADKRL